MNRAEKDQAENQPDVTVDAMRKGTEECTEFALDSPSSKMQFIYPNSAYYIYSITGGSVAEPEPAFY